MNTALTLGLLGVSPVAALEFLANLQACTPARQARDHLRVIADINPRAPDLNTPGSGAGPALAEMAGALRGAGAQVLAIASNSAHSHLGLIERASGLAVIDMIETASKAAAETGARRIGVLGSRSALRLYREYLAARAVGLVSLEAEAQQHFSRTLEAIRSGELGEPSRQALAGFIRQLAAGGAEAVVAGAVELAPLLGQPGPRGRPVIDPCQLLARRCAAVCLGLEPAPSVAG